MARLRYDNSIGTLGASLSSGGTTITFASAPSFATISGSDYIPLILEPPSGSTPSANFEIVWLTAYVAGATTGTISRGKENTSGVAHSNGVVWTHGPTAADMRSNIYGTDFGDGAATSFAITHGLGNAYPTVVVYNKSTGQVEDCTVTSNSTSQLTLSAEAWTASPPAANAYHVTVVG